jgi:hypothetical protein
MFHPERLEGAAGPLPITLEPHAIETVEAVLGVPLMPPDSDMPVHTGDIRGYAYQTVLDALKVPAADADPGRPAVAALAESERMTRLGRHLQVANDLWVRAEQLPLHVEGDPRATFQSSALRHIIAHAQRPPLEGTAVTPSSYREGYLTMAPPGAGKSVLQAELVAGAGIGLPYSERDPAIRTAVGMVGSRWLIQQQIEPDSTLRRFMAAAGRDIPVGAYYSESKNGHDEYPLLLTTYQSYKDGLRRGAINKDSAVYLLDEAHEAGHAPSMQPELPHFGSNLFMFTATPAIASGRRDLRHRFPHSQFGSMAEFVRDGILSPIQLFSYRAEADPGSAEHIAVRLACDYIASGRKTVVVCQPGSSQAQARRVADMINRQYQEGAFRPHERFDWSGDEPARAIGTYDKNNINSELINLRQNNRLALTSVHTGRNGLDIPDLDAIILIGPQGAAWNVEQWLGRVLRPSGRLAVAAEILPHTIPEGRPIASIFARFGLEKERIIAGYYLGPDVAEIDEPEQGDPKLSAPLKPPASETAMIDADSTTKAPGSYTSPPDLNHVLINNVPLREATLAPADFAKLPPEGYKPLDYLLPEGVPVNWLYATIDKLDNPDMRYVGYTDWDSGGEAIYRRHYSPATHAYFARHPVPELLKDNEYSAPQLAEILDISVKYVRRFIAAGQFEPIKRATMGYGKNANHYDASVFTSLREHVASLPLAEETDVPLWELALQTTPDFLYAFTSNPVNQVTQTDKWRHPVWGIRGVVKHVSAETAERIRAAYYGLGQADPEQMMTYNDIARRAGVSLSQVCNRFNEAPLEALPPINWLRAGVSRRAVMHVDRRWGEAFSDYIAPERILPWELSVRGVARYFGKAVMATRFILERRVGIGVLAESTKHAIPATSAASMYGIEALRLVEADGHARAEGMPQFNPDLAAMGPDQRHDAARIAYNLQFQSYLLPKEQLVTPETLEWYWQRRVNPPQLPYYTDMPTIDEPPEEEVPAHQDTSLVSLLQKELQEARDGQPPAGWLSLAQLGESIEGTHEDATDTLQSIVATRNYPLQEGEALLYAGGTDGEPQLYFSPRMGIIAKRFMNGRD